MTQGTPSAHPCHYISGMRTRIVFPVLTAAILLAGCHKAAPKPVEMGEVLPNIPLPPQAQPLVHEGGAEAMQFLFATPVAVDSIVSYYRATLSAGAFHLVNEVTKGKTTSFYAEQDGPSIWVTVSPNGTEGSQVMIAGATDASGRKINTPGIAAPDSGGTASLPVRKP